MGGAAGSDRTARRTGRRNHAWVNHDPGRSTCEKCGLKRKFVKKRGGKRWKVYYQTTKDAARKTWRPQGPLRKVPSCVRAGADSGVLGPATPNDPEGS